jgi:hypothetical protein
MANITAGPLVWDHTWRRRAWKIDTTTSRDLSGPIRGPRRHGRRKSPEWRTDPLQIGAHQRSARNETRTWNPRACSLLGAWPQVQSQSAL